MRGENDLLIIDWETNIQQNTSIRISQYDEEDTLVQQQPEYEIHQPRRPSSKFPFFRSIVLLILAIISGTYIYALTPKYSTQVIDGIRYNLVPTAYPKNVLNGTKSIYNSTQASEQSHIWFYLREQQVQKYKNNETQQYLANLLEHGKMVDELQAWILNNIGRQQSCLVFWSDRLAISVVLLGHLLKEKEKGQILILFDYQLQSTILQGFKQTIKFYNLEGIITILNTIEWVLPNKISYYNLIITSGLYFHTKIIQLQMQEVNPFSQKIQEELSKAFEFEYKESKLILLYDGYMAQTQITELQVLNNQISVLKKGQLTPFYSLIPLTNNENAIRQESMNIVIVSNELKPQKSSKHPSNQKSSKTDINNHEQTNQQTMDHGNQFQLYENSNQANEDSYNEYMQIRRLSSFQISSKMPCTTKKTLLESNPQQSIFEHIKILNQSKDGPDFQDHSHLAKFLANFYEAIPVPTSTFYCLQSQIIVNLVALISKRNLLIPYWHLKNQSLIERSLLANQLHKSYIFVKLDPSNFFQLFKENEVRLLFCQLKYLEEWSPILQILLKQGLNIIVQRKQTDNQTKLVQSYFEKGFKIYVIFYRSNSQFDYKCIRDYQMELIDFQKAYPAKSFYFITEKFIYLDLYDPIQFLNITTTTRKIDILPYRCAQPPYYITQEQLLSANYFLTDNKYHFPVYLSQEQALAKNKTGTFDEDFIQFINSCLVSSDQIVFHSQAIENMLLVVSLAKKIKPYGSISFTSMPTQKEKILVKNLQKNDVETPTEILRVNSQDFMGVKQQINAYKPNLIITTTKILISYQQILDNLPKGTLVALNYAQDRTYQDVMVKLSSKYSLYQIVTDMKEKLSYNRCQNYKTSILTPENFHPDKVSWIFFYL